jgi:nucleoside-diphosphate-sugar epimerase
MLSGEKILITGPAGQIAAPLCEYLAKDNEMWGIARFSVPGSREEVEAMGVTTRVVDLATGDFSEVPTDFTYVLHLAAAIGPSTDYDQSLRVNAEATGLLLSHCRNVKAAMVMSTNSVYKPNADPSHRYTETDALGEAIVPGVPTYSVTKIAEEAVARYVARELGIRVVIARMNVAYSPRGGLPLYHLDMVASGSTVNVRDGEAKYSPIHQDDINRQTEALLDAAASPALVVNWGGDDVVGPRDWCAEWATLTGRPADIAVQPVPGSQPGSASDNTKRLSITGPCTVRFAEGMKRAFEGRYPNGPDGGIAGGMSNPLASAASPAPNP